ncbi:MAG: xanthine dehydrogenase family protein molybdopterin-binding subunit [Alphaproteobacteria bacterium]|nr:xanthine dehydrogenase family protein molybdopterin-binding subunit [Alphaproteobacteria bacterium]
MADEKPDYKWVGTRTIRPDGHDKVTGRAKFGSDFSLSGMIHGRVLRSPHAHAVIKSIDTSAAEALTGVRAVITSKDFKDQPSEMIPAGEAMVNYKDMTRNIMAREKALYDGHAVAAVAATTVEIAEAALELIKVDYEVLPHVIDVDDAMQASAPVLHGDLVPVGMDATGPTNIAKRVEFTLGDATKGFEAADVVIERSFKTAAVHQGYIEPHAVVAAVAEDGQAQIWCCTQGQFMVRTFVAQLLGMPTSSIRVTPSEIGGGFGGKTVVYLEPLATLLSKMTGRPVKMTMSREEVFRASGPTSAGSMTFKIGATKAGKITAVEAEIKLLAGAFPGSPVQPACMCAVAPYDIENVHIVGYDVVVNRPKVAAYRAPGAPISAFGAESIVDELAKELGIDPLQIRSMNAAKDGTKAAYGPTFRNIGYEETVNQAIAHDHYKAPLGPNQGRGVASGFWFNIGGESSATVNIAEDGTAVVVSGNPDVGGSRASLAMMAAEELGIDYSSVRPIIGDTASVGYNFLTGGSRVTFATGLAVVEAARDAVRQLCERAAKIWEVDADGVIWDDGHAKPASTNVGEFEPLSLASLAASASKTGGPICGHNAQNVQGAGPGFATHICDVEVDPETGCVTVLRYTAIQDVGRAIHPAYVEGQIQGGAAQGIGWALNEEYIYSDKGTMDNPGFLDYRIPVASDLPMIEAVMVEVPNDRHPYGVRGVGEVPIVPPMAAVANAIENATGVRMEALPMSPPKILAALDAVKLKQAAE